MRKLDTKGLSECPDSRDCFAKVKTTRRQFCRILSGNIKYEDMECPFCKEHVTDPDETHRKSGTLDIRSLDHSEILCLPRTAKCKETGLSPLMMDICPLAEFDEEGRCCYPALCDAYTD